MSWWIWTLIGVAGLFLGYMVLRYIVNQMMDVPLKKWWW